VDGRVTKKHTLPDGYDLDGFLQEARERYQEAVDFDRENRDAGIEDAEFASGKQWDEADERRRIEAGRPCLKVNTLPQFIAQIVGDIRINRPAIRVRPAEDADKDLADVREGLIRQIERQSGAQQVYSAAAQDQVTGGIGNFRVNIEYAADDTFERDIAIKRIPDPFAVAWDPLMLDPTGADARYCFVEDQMPRKAFEKAYPDAHPSELQVREHGWISVDSVKVTEYWLVKNRPVELGLTFDGQVLEVGKDTDRTQLQATRKGSKRSVCMYLITGHAILEGPYELPVSRIPIFRVPGWEMQVGSKKSRWGLVRFAKDPARLRNYWRSVAAETLALAPRAQWLINTGSGGMNPDSADEFRENATSGDTVLEYQGQQPPQRIDPPPFPAALVQEAALNAQDIKDVTGLHDASLGARSNETSGKAILARQKEGDVASFIYHDNLHAAIREAGKVVNELIPVVYDTARTIRIVGEDESTKVMQVNAPGAVNLQQGKYDIVVEAGPSYSTKRQEASESMMQFVQAVPPAAQVAADLIAKAQDWPMADMIAKRLKAALPPQITDDDDEEQTPEQMQAKQAAAMQAQQQAQMQQQAAMLGMAEQEAKVMKLRADAEHTMAQARTVGVQQDNETPLDVALKEAQLQKARADADKAYFEAERARIAMEADAFNLQTLPLEAANKAADLDNKINPPETATGGAGKPPKKRPPAASAAAA
jgi:hypothetical protein